MHVQLFVVHGLLQNLLNLGNSDTATKNFNLFNFIDRKTCLVEGLLDWVFDARKKLCTFLFEGLSAQLESQSNIVGKLWDLHVDDPVGGKDSFDTDSLLVNALHRAVIRTNIRFTLPFLQRVKFVSQNSRDYMVELFAA